MIYLNVIMLIMILNNLNVINTVFLCEGGTGIPIMGRVLVI